MKTAIVAFLMIVLFASLVFANSANFKTARASVNVSGIINTDTTWTLANSPYIVTSDILVDTNVHLYVESGVTVKFALGTNLLVDGALHANGNATHPVTFTSNAATPAPGDWGTIDFRSGYQNSVMQWANVNYGNNGITVSSSSPAFVYCSISNNQRFGIYVSAGAPTIANSKIFDNGDDGIYNYVGNITIADSTISGNKGNGIYKDSASITVRTSVISNNSESGIYGGAGGKFDVSDSTISNNGRDGVTIGYSDMSITRSEITYNNGDGVHMGTGTLSGGAIITENSISHNKGNGVYKSSGTMKATYNNITFNGVGIAATPFKLVTSTSFQEKSGDTIIDHNNILNNTFYAVENLGPGTNVFGDTRALNAAYNWWGTNNPSAIDQLIRDRSDDFSLGPVNYVPFLTEPAYSSQPGPIQTLGPTYVTGVINTDTAWTQTGSPYIFTGNVLVSEGVTLAIQPGAAVVFGGYYLRINGTLSARGITSNKITFTTGNPSAPTDNSAIDFKSSGSSWNEQTNSGSIIENVVINSTWQNGLGAIKIESVAPKINNNIINSPNNGRLGTAIYSKGANPTLLITNNLISGSVTINEGKLANNTILGQVEAYGGLVCNNTVRNSQGFGIRLRGAATASSNTVLDSNVGIATNVLSSSSSIVALIQGNLIYNNNYGVQIQMGAEVEPGKLGLSTIAIKNNTVTNNSVGVYLYSDWDVLNSHQILNNNIYDNRNSNLRTSLKSDVNATDNWWGTTDTQAINSTIYDFKNDFNLGKVNFAPFLTEPNPSAPPAPVPTPTPNPTFIAGVIGSDTSWTIAGSPYIFAGDVTIAPGAKLTINPGVTVDFGSSSLIVNGTLQARGAEADRIKFRSSQQIVGAWPPRIYFTDTSTRWNEIAGTGCIIEYVEINVTNYQYETIRDGYPKISNSIFYNYGNDAAAIYTKGGIISNNTILGGYRGIETEKSEGALILYNVIKDTEGGAAITVGFDTAPTIVGNLLIDNREGITFWNPNGPYIANNTLLRNIVGFRFTNYITSSSLGKILYNNINSTGYNVKVEKTDPQIVVNMTYNWWGTTNATLIDQKIYDQKDDAKLSLVAYAPFLETPALTGSPDYIPPAPSPSPSPMPTPTPTPSSTQISISVDVSSTLVGAAVNVKGRLLDTNATSLQGRLIILSYAIAGGGSWVQIGSGITDFAGRYNIQWVNTGSGTFTLKAEWNGDANYYSSSALTTLSFLPYENQRQFCVESNSTVTALAFDSATSELTFTVSGFPGTAGYAKVAIAKSLVSNPGNLKVYLDGNHVDYAVKSTEDSWILSFNYLHSSHEVRIATAAVATTEPPVQGLTYWVWAAAAVIIAMVVGLGCVAVLRIRKKRNQFFLFGS